MTSSASSATWVPAVIARVAVVTPLPQALPVAPTGGRHNGPEFAQVLEIVASEFDLERRGQHAEPRWSREVYDSARDEDPFDWLGFVAD